MGAVDFVAREGNFVPVAAGLIERRLRLATHNQETGGFRHGQPGEAFGEMLRHEVNNPLTGILGNAELLLARREVLPVAVIARVQTIAALAVRLRETVRRLSLACGSNKPAQNGASAEEYSVDRARSRLHHKRLALVHAPAAGSAAISPSFVLQEPVEE